MPACLFSFRPLGYYRGGVEIPGMDYVDVGVNLIDSLGYDFMFLHPEVLDEKCILQNNKLILQNPTQHNSFSVLIVPASPTISLSNLKKIEQFAEGGGTIIFTGHLPHTGTLAKDNEEIKQLVKKITSTEKYNTYFIEKPDVELLLSLFGKLQDNFTLRFNNTERVKNIHKIVNGKNIWFLANTENEAKIPDIMLEGNLRLKIWDPHTGNIYKSEDIQKGRNNTRLRIPMEGLSSLFLVEE